MTAPPPFPALFDALGPPPKVKPFPGVIVCAICDYRPCWCCPDCGYIFGLCRHGGPPEPEPIDPAVLAAVQVLTERGVNGTNYEELQRIAAERHA